MNTPRKSYKKLFLEKDALASKLLNDLNEERSFRIKFQDALVEYGEEVCLKLQKKINHYKLCCTPLSRIGLSPHEFFALLANQLQGRLPPDGFCKYCFQGVEIVLSTKNGD